MRDKERIRRRKRRWKIKKNIHKTILLIRHRYIVHSSRLTRVSSRTGVRWQRFGWKLMRWQRFIRLVPAVHNWSKTPMRWQRFEYVWWICAQSYASVAELMQPLFKTGPVIRLHMRRIKDVTMKIIPSLIIIIFEAFFIPTCM